MHGRVRWLLNLPTWALMGGLVLLSTVLRTVAGLESGELEPTAAAIEPLAETLR